MSGCHDHDHDLHTGDSVAPRSAGALALPSVTRSGRAGRSLAGQRLAERRALARRAVGGFAVMAVVGSTLGLTAGPGQAEETPAPAKAPSFAGYSAASSASPLKLEVYEPTIPLPAEPQLELSLGYSKVQAESSSSGARASYLWPGDPIGEGFKTIIEMLGLPPEIAGPLGENGYPVQVNATFPSGPGAQADEPLPGMIQRATADQDTARAENGFSIDGQAKGDGDDKGGSGGSGGLPGLPLPGLPGLTNNLSGLGSLVTSLLGGDQATSKAGSGRTNAGVAAAPPALPAPLSALIDLGGFTSVSRTDNTKEAFAQSRSLASDISLLGGLVTIESIKTIATATSDGAKGKGTGSAVFGDIVIAGQRFAFGSDGYEAVGTKGPLPGLPAQGTELLEKLGLTISLPKPVYKIEGDAASTRMPGLVIDFDLKTLRKQLTPLTNVLDQLVGAIPESAGPLKSLVQALANAAPRIVVTLGTSSASVDTSQAIAPPPPAPVDPTEDPTEDPAGGGAPTSSGGSGSAPPVTPIDSGPVAPDSTGEVPTTDEAVSPVSSAAAAVPGLPPLLSFPGLLLYGGLLGAGLAGAFARRLGLLALGSAGSCPHGLTSGLPDLRKVT